MKSVHFTISGLIELEQDIHIHAKYIRTYEEAIRKKLNGVLNHVESETFSDPTVWKGESYITEVVLDIPEDGAITAEKRNILQSFADALKKYDLSSELDLNSFEIKTIAGYQRTDEPMVSVTFCGWFKQYELCMSCYKKNGHFSTLRRSCAAEFDYDKYAQKIKEYYLTHGII